MFHLHIS